MKEINYIVWKEGSYYISQCLNVEVASFGATIEEAIQNLLEAVALYFDGEKLDYQVTFSTFSRKSMLLEMFW